MILVRWVMTILLLSACNSVFMHACPAVAPSSQQALVSSECVLVKFPILPKIQNTHDRCLEISYAMYTLLALINFNSTDTIRKF